MVSGAREEDREGVGDPAGKEEQGGKLDDVVSKQYRGAALAQSIADRKAQA